MMSTMFCLHWIINKGIAAMTRVETKVKTVSEAFINIDVGERFNKQKALFLFPSFV